MFNDVIDGKIDYENEYNEVLKILEEAKAEILKERKLRDAAEILYHETVVEGKEICDVLNEYRKKFGIQDFDNLTPDEEEL